MTDMPHAALDDFIEAITSNDTSDILRTKAEALAAELTADAEQVLEELRSNLRYALLEVIIAREDGGQP
jgi:hypothetical protein